MKNQTILLEVENLTNRGKSLINMGPDAERPQSANEFDDSPPYYPPQNQIILLEAE